MTILPYKQLLHPIICSLGGFLLTVVLGGTHAVHADDAQAASRTSWIVTWGDDQGRFNSDLSYNSHRQRWADVPGDTTPPPFPEAPLEYFETAEDGEPGAVDLDNDGRIDDDYVAAIRFSLKEPLSAPAWPHSGAYPGQINGRFFGGYTWMVANAEPRSHPVYTEIGINADHHWPYSDGRADDMPLKGMGRSTPDSWHLHYLLHLWQKRDFLNVDERTGVSLDSNSQLAVMVNRYWVGFNELRFVVRDGQTFYISEQSFGQLTSNARLPKTFILNPTRTRWAVYRPRAPYHIAFDPNKARFHDQTFDNLTAVGWYLAKSRPGKSLSHTKWYAFEARATVNYPAGSDRIHLDTVDIPGSADVPAFQLSRTEVPYRLWKRIYRWADMPTYIHAPRYHFRRDGDIGNARVSPGPHTQAEPVTNITIHDIAAWCNALSELEGRTPCYYTDAAHEQVFRFEALTTRYRWIQGQARHLENPRYFNDRGEAISPFGCEGMRLPSLHVRWEADGYRLPTAAEWREAYRRGAAWETMKIGRGRDQHQTHAVDEGRADRLGLRGMLGNVWEPVWTWGDRFNPDVDDRLLLMGGDLGYPANRTPPGASASIYPENLFAGGSNVGFRPVRRAGDLPTPPTGDLPEQPGASMVATDESAPRWLVKKGQRTGRHESDAAPNVRIEMKAVPAGAYLINQGQWHERQITVSPFEMSAFAITFAQWSAVGRWAEARGYEFDRSGDLGSSYWSQETQHTTDEPVTRISLWDAMVFCNALSVMHGRTPCYYTDPQRSRPLTKAFIQRPPRLPPPAYGSQPNYMPWVFVNWAADGYRLPTSPEYLSAISSGKKRLPRYFWGESFDEMDGRVWHMFSRNSEGRLAGKTHGTARTRVAKQPNPLGLYDLVGNVYELCWSTQRGSDPTRHPLMDLHNPKYSRFWMYGQPEHGHRLRGRGTTFGTSWRWGFPKIRDGSGPGTHQFGGGYRDEAMPDTGFRIVRCEAGTHPVDGREPLESQVVLDFDPAAFDPLPGAAHRYSLHRNAVFPGPGVPDKPRLGALFETAGPVRSSPVVYQGIAYLGARPAPDGRGGAFYAIDADSMQLLWKVDVPGGVDGSACVRDQTVYFGGRDGRLYAVAAGPDGGEIRWAVPTGRDTMDSAPGVAHGTVFVLNGGYGPDAGIKGFRATDGQMAYLYPAHPFGRSAVCLTPELALCTHTAADRVYAARLRDEMPAWTGKLLSHSRNDVVVSRGVVYAVMGGGMIGGFNKPGQMGAFDLQTGRNLWKRPIEQHINGTAYCFSSPVIFDGRLFIGMDNGYLHVYDAETGQPLPWRIRATDEDGQPAMIRTSPSVSAPNGTVYFGAGDGVLRAINGQTGQTRWRLRLSADPIDSSVWVQHSHLFVGTSQGLVRVDPVDP